jgi:hypothetical protein
MIWLSWRQFRTSASIAAAGLAAAAVVLWLTTHGATVSRCFGGDVCDVSGGSMFGLAHNHLLQYLSTLLVGLPALIGAFWGAPLMARELESGTYRLAWTQSVTKNHWLRTKVVVVGLAAALVCGALSLMLGAWSSASINRDRLLPAMFGERGVAPIAYAVFGLALGLALGLLIRRTVPAMAATLVAFIGVRMAFQYWLRAHLVPLHHATMPIGDGVGISQTPSGVSLESGSIHLPGAWTTSSHIVDDTGHGPTAAFVNSVCNLPPPPAVFGTGRARVPAGIHRSLNECFAQVGARFHGSISYHPLSQYWALQWAETGAFIAMAAALIGFCFWRLRR